MNLTLDYLKSNRKWLIREFRVWGDDGAVEGDMLLSESDASGTRIVFSREFPGGLDQVVSFDDLIDHRGNQLPSTIKNAEIVLIPKNTVPVFIRGSIGPSAFRIARDRGVSDDGIVDLLIQEMS